MCQVYQTQMEEMYQKFYMKKRHGIGGCPHYAACKASIRAEETAYTIPCSRSARIGSKYGVYPKLPKVLFLGKEDVVMHSEIKPPASFRECKNPHYRGTRDVLAALFGVTDAVEKNGKTYSMQIDGETEELHELYALSNQYHCAFKTSKSNRNVRTDDTMRKNCSELVRNEIDILRPDIVVIQAEWATKPSAQEDIQRYFSNGTVEADGQIPRLFWVLDARGRKVCCIISAYHPGYPRWLSGENKVYLDACVKQAREWVSLSREACRA